MVKITDVLAAMVEGQARAAEWEAEFNAQFFGPLMMAQQVQQFLSMPHEAHKQMPPEMFQQMAGHADRMSQMVPPTGGQDGQGY